MGGLSEQDNMRKLIIGCGYLGQRVAARWSSAGDEVVTLTRSPARAEEFQSRGWRAVVGDVMEPSSLQNLPEVETVLYAVGFDRSSGLSQREVYVTGLKNVLKALAHRVRHWIYVSSTSVYGQHSGEWIDETSPAEPLRENGQICLEAESLVERHFPGGENARRANILRLAGIYGPGRLLRRLADLKAGLAIQGDPEGWLNLIHVDDAAEVVLACEQRGEPGAMYLVSDDEPVRRRDYYSLLCELAGVAMPAFDSGSAPRHGEGLGKRCSNRKIRQDLGVELRYPSIRQGLPQALSGHFV